MKILIEKISGWNPQLFIELKQRLTSKNMIASIILSLLIQGCVWFYFYSQLATAQIACLNKQSSLYHSIIKDSLDKMSCAYTVGNITIEWQSWYGDIFICLSWILSIGAILGSVCLLIIDLAQEKKCGTLDLIRLTPQSVPRIFIGKVLGVPILLYLTIATILPSHLFAQIGSGGSLKVLIAWYLAIGSLWWLFSTATILAFLLRHKAIFILAFILPICLCVRGINRYGLGNLDDYGIGRYLPHSWFWIPIGLNSIAYYAFTSTSCLVASYWIWQMIKRCYFHDSITIISKKQSYLINLCLQIWFAGLAIPIMFSNNGEYFHSSSVRGDWAQSVKSGVMHLDWLVSIAFIPLLLPSKQSLQNWSYNFQKLFNHQPRTFWRLRLFQDLINNDDSPSLLAMVINLSISAILWLSINSYQIDYDDGGIKIYNFESIPAILIWISTILIYNTIAHLVELGNHKNTKTMIILIITILANILIFLGMAIEGSESTILDSSMLVGYFITLMFLLGFSPSTTVVSIFLLAQFVLLVILNINLRQKIKILGRD